MEETQDHLESELTKVVADIFQARDIPWQSKTMLVTNMVDQKKLIHITVGQVKNNPLKMVSFECTKSSSFSAIASLQIDHNKKNTKLTTFNPVK